MSKTRPGRSPRPSRSFSLGLAITLACLSTLTACPEPDGASATAEASSPPAAKDETPAASAHPVGKPEPASAPRNPNERPLPAFEGTTVGGGRLALLLRRKALLAQAQVMLDSLPQTPSPETLEPHSDA